MGRKGSTLGEAMLMSASNNRLKMNKKPKMRQIAGIKKRRKLNNIFKSEVRKAAKIAAGRPIRQKRNRKEKP